MMDQRLDEWTKNYNNDYFERQFKTPYRSTVKFCDWLEELKVLNPQTKANIVDIGTGKGANLHYMNQRFPNCTYLGMDINKDFIDEGNKAIEKENLSNCHLEYGDLYNLDLAKHANKFDGIISYQTLSWLPEYETALEEIIKLNPKWITLSSLFYDGLVDCKIEVKEFHSPEDEASFKTSFYNIYSLPRIKHFFATKGFKTFKYSPFEIDIDLPKPDHSNMQTYTQKLMDGKRQQMSGPVPMSWFFIYAEK
jgi:ubiquinone/menaquinone biosynthesis C-methylase UbiE